MAVLMRRVLALAAVLAAAACATAPPAPQRVETPREATERRAQAAKPTYNLTGYPPAMRDGYIDGCESAKGTAHAHKDAARMSGDPQYSMGWNDGYSICKAK